MPVLTSPHRASESSETTSLSRLPPPAFAPYFFVLQRHLPPPALTALSDPCFLFSDSAPKDCQICYKAICNGINLKKVFVTVEELRKEGSELPIVFMMYYNTILHYGVEAFVKKCNEVGVDGLIIPDLPLEEQEEIAKYLNQDETTILIQLVSPVSGDRIPKILDGAKGFVYCVSSMGVTGQGADFHKEVLSYLKSVKAVAKIPVMMGFGIRTAEDVKPMKDTIDGAIVGSHFIRLMEENDYSTKVAAEYCSTFKKELN